MMMEVCVNNNVAWTCQKPTESRRPKRDFRFQVIEVCQGPKWFIWPSRNRGSHENVDENHNKATKSIDNTPSYSGQQYVSYASTQNGYGAMRRSVLRSSKRKQMEGPDAIPSPRTASEPAANRRLSLKKEKASTEPISTNGSSNTFKILSVAKKWESFDATDDELDADISASCRTLCLDDAERRKTSPN